jgi:hypothetical protein
MSPLQERMALVRIERERARRSEEDKIIADAQAPGADLLMREVAQQIIDSRTSPK